jgi:hypothetical protein
MCSYIKQITKFVEAIKGSRSGIPSYINFKLCSSNAVFGERFLPGNSPTQVALMPSRPPVDLLDEEGDDEEDDQPQIKTPHDLPPPTNQPPPPPPPDSNAPRKLRDRGSASLNFNHLMRE